MGNMVQHVSIERADESSVRTILLLLEGEIYSVDALWVLEPQVHPISPGRKTTRGVPIEEIPRDGIFNHDRPTRDLWLWAGDHVEQEGRRTYANGQADGELHGELHWQFPLIVIGGVTLIPCGNDLARSAPRVTNRRDAARLDSRGPLALGSVRTTGQVGCQDGSGYDQ